MTDRARRPESSEYAPYYARYVSVPPDGDIVETLVRDGRELVQLLGGLAEAKGSFRYAEGKWSVKQLVGHIVDSERVFVYRALRFARGDSTELPGFEQDVFVAHANFDSRTLANLVREFEHVRAASVDLFASLDQEAFGRAGIASSNRVTVRALAWIVAGHAGHHANVLRERYLGI